MKMKAVIQITTESYEEEQFIISRFPSAVWVAPTSFKRDKVLFYLPYQQYQEVKNAIEEWKKVNETKKGN